MDLDTNRTSILRLFLMGNNYIQFLRYTDD